MAEPSAANVLVTGTGRFLIGAGVTEVSIVPTMMGVVPMNPLLSVPLGGRGGPETTLSTLTVLGSIVTSGPGMTAPLTTGTGRFLTGAGTPVVSTVPMIMIGMPSLGLVV